MPPFSVMARWVRTVRRRGSVFLAMALVAGVTSIYAHVPDAANALTPAKILPPPSSKPFNISTNVTAYAPVAAYNTVADTYLVVWQDTTGDGRVVTNIYGR